ncbi:hypothetical protein AgCh_002869 [Apium graveolens]
MAGKNVYVFSSHLLVTYFLIILTVHTGLGAADPCLRFLDIGTCAKYGGASGCDRECRIAITYGLSGSCKPVGSEAHCFCCLSSSQ